MKKTIVFTAVVALSVLLSSCGLARGLGQTAQRTMQSVGRTVF
jgi:predicted small secreted protein